MTRKELDAAYNAGTITTTQYREGGGRITLRRMRELLPDLREAAEVSKGTDDEQFAADNLASHEAEIAKYAEWLENQ